MGFPGTVRATCTYSIAETDGHAALRVAFSATTDAPTLVNFGHHSYFCLDDSRDIRKHHLRIDADRYLPTDETALPTGEVAAVDGTGFDFRTSRPVEGAFDHNFCLADLRRDLAPVAQLIANIRIVDAGQHHRTRAATLYRSWPERRWFEPWRPWERTLRRHMPGTAILARRTQ